MREYEYLTQATFVVAKAASQIWRANECRQTPAWSMMHRVHRYLERQAEDALAAIMRGDA